VISLRIEFFVTMVSSGLVGRLVHQYDNVFFPFWGGISTRDSHPVSQTLETIIGGKQLKFSMTFLTDDAP
jgi:hypothetical protein